MPLRARLSPEALAASPDAMAWYAGSLEPSEARAWVLRAASCLGRREWAELCVGAAHLSRDRSPDGWRELALKVADHVVAETSASEWHSVLRAIVELPAMRAALAPIGAWLARRGTAGDAGVIATWLSTEGLDVTPDVRLDLEIALLERGSAELRRRERMLLAERIVERMDRDRTDLRELALRVLLINEGARAVLETPDGEPVWMPPPRPLEEPRAQFLAIAERALEHGADASLAMDVAAFVGWQAAARTVLQGSELPRVRAALVEAIAQDERIPWGGVVRACLRTLLDSAHDLPPLGSPRVIEEAIAVADQAGRERGATDAQRRKLERWTLTVAESWLALHGLCGERVDDTRWLAWVLQPRLSSLLENPAFHAPVRTALERRLATATGAGLGPARAILEAHPDEPAAVVPAFGSLPDRADVLARSGVSVSLDELAHELERLFLRAWPTPICGVRVADLVGSATKISLVALEDERKFEVSRETLRLDEGSLASVVSGASGETALALAALYVAHELVHGAQGLDDKGVVDALRATGSETMLLHLDLAADHAAAMIVHQARRSWPVEWLKELHGTNTRKFPVGAHHIAAARARKVGRVLGLRVDLLVRRHAMTRRLGDGYAFAELGPAGGKLVVLASGPPVTVLGQTDLGSDDAKLLARAADRDAPSAEELDAVLLRLLRAACGTDPG